VINPRPTGAVSAESKPKAKRKKAGNISKKKPIEQYNHKGEEAGEQSAGRAGEAGI